MYISDNGLAVTYSTLSTVGRVAYNVVCLMTLECTRGAINPLYHCRHSAARDGRYEFDRAIKIESDDWTYILGMTEMWLLRVKLLIASYDGDRM